MIAADPDAPGVVQFPDQASRSWRWIRDALHSIYRGQGIADDVLDPSLDTVGEIYKRLRGAVVPRDANPDDAMAVVVQWVHDLTLLLLNEIATREIELRQAGLRN